MNQVDEMYDIFAICAAAGSLKPFNDTKVKPQARFEDVGKGEEAYWDLIHRNMRDLTDAPDIMEIISEQETCNPVRPETIGKDQEPHVTPNWIDGEDLIKLDKMKRDLHDLGDKLAAADTNMEEPKAKKIWQQIKEMQSKIDELSNALSPNIKKDRQS